MTPRLHLDGAGAAGLSASVPRKASAISALLGPMHVASLTPLPPLLDRPTVACLARLKFGVALSPRFVEPWPLKVTYVNGRAHYNSADVLGYLTFLVEGAARIPGGRAKKAAR
jgi:hypothetical protein